MRRESERETGRVERKGMLPLPFPRVRSLDGHQKIYPVRPAECGLHYSVSRSVGSVPPPPFQSGSLPPPLFPVQYSRMISFGNEGKSGVPPRPASPLSLPPSYTGQFRDKNPFDLKGKRTDADRRTAGISKEGRREGERGRKKHR